MKFLLLLLVLLPLTVWYAAVIQALQVSGVSVHRVPLQFNDPSSPFCHVVSSPMDLMNVNATSESSSVSSSSTPNFLATQVWPAARVASYCIQQFLDPSWSVWEFGCGPGLPSLTALSLGSPHVTATDLDPLALKLVASAANAQGWSDRCRTRVWDLTMSLDDSTTTTTTTTTTSTSTTSSSLPEAHDVYILSDVFESQAVAQGAAHLVHAILDQPQRQQQLESRVWVFCQSDRAQRDSFLETLVSLSKQQQSDPRDNSDNPTTQQQPKDKTIAWTPFDKNDPGPSSDQRLWLCSIDETQVNYG